MAGRTCSSIVKSFCTFLGDGEQKCQMVVWSSFGHRSFATFSANKIGVRSLLNRKFKNFQERRVWSWSEAKVWLYQYIRQTICAAPPKKEQTFQRHADVSKIQSIYWHHFIKFCLPPHLRETKYFLFSFQTSNYRSLYAGRTYSNVS